MERSDSSSDSDSSSSTSWVFVDDASKSVSQASNTFHLDCSREPIQELTEQDLLSGGSDFESDTDGISVISESEVPPDDIGINGSSNENDNHIQVVPEISSDVTSSLIPQNDNDSPETKEPLIKQNIMCKLAKLFTPVNLFGAGMVLTAIIWASCNSTAVKNDNMNSEDRIDIEDEINDDKLPLHERNIYWHQNLNHYNTDVDFSRDLEQIVDITMTCAMRYKPLNDYINKQIKKCVKKEYTQKKTECSENLCGPNNNADFNTNINFRASHISIANNPVSKSRDQEKLDKRILNFDKPSGGVTIKLNNIKKINKAEKAKDKSHKTTKKNDDKCEIKDFYKDQDFANRKYARKHKKEKRQKNIYEKYKHSDKTSSKHKKQYNVIKSSSVKSKSQGNIKTHKTKDYTTIPFRKNSKYHYKNAREHSDSFLNKDKKIKKRDFSYNTKSPKGKRNSSTSGEWYTNLHKGRREIRKQEHLSDWVFDRAYYRSKKRNKAQWYFKWMNVREQLRYKHSYKPYSS